MRISCFCSLGFSGVVKDGITSRQHTQGLSVVFLPGKRELTCKGKCPCQSESIVGPEAPGPASDLAQFSEAQWHSYVYSCVPLRCCLISRRNPPETESSYCSLCSRNCQAHNSTASESSSVPLHPFCPLCLLKVFLSVVEVNHELFIPVSVHCLDMSLLPFSLDSSQTF